MLLLYNLSEDLVPINEKKDLILFYMIQLRQFIYLFFEWFKLRQIDPISLLQTTVFYDKARGTVKGAHHYILEVVGSSHITYKKKKRLPGLYF